MAQRLGTVFVELDLKYDEFTKKQQRVLESAKQTSMSAEANFRNLGVQSDNYLQARTNAVLNSYNMLKNRAETSTQELVRIERAKTEKLAEIQRDWEGKQKGYFARQEEGAAASIRSMLRLYAAYYVGSAAGQALFGSTIQASLGMERLNIAMKSATGDGTLAGKELAYVREESERLGLVFDSTTREYMKFSAATRNTAIEGEASRKIFTGMSEAITALKLDTQDANLIYMAMTQMISKGTVSMEELRRQMGERLPGAIRLAAEGMGMTTEALIKQIESGKVLATDLLPKLAEQLHKTYGTAAMEAAKSGQAAINRFNNALFETKSIVGDLLMPTFGKWAEGIAKALREFNQQTKGERPWFESITHPAWSKMPGGPTFARATSSQKTAGELLAEEQKVIKNWQYEAPSYKPYVKPGQTVADAAAEREKQRKEVIESAQALSKIYEDVYGKLSDKYTAITADTNKKILELEDEKLGEIYEKNLVNLRKVTDSELVEYKGASEYIANLRSYILSNEGIQAWTDRLSTLFTVDWPAYMGISGERYKELDRMFGDLNQTRADIKLKLEKETQSKIKDVTLTAQEDIAKITADSWSKTADSVGGKWKQVIMEIGSYWTYEAEVSNAAIASTSAALWSSLNSGFFADSSGSNSSQGVGEYTGLPIGVINTSGQNIVNAINNTWAQRVADDMAERERQEEEELRAQEQYFTQQQRLWNEQIAAQRRFVESLHEQSMSITEWLSAINRGSLAPAQSSGAWDIEYARQKGLAFAPATTPEEEAAKTQAISSYLTYAKDYLEFQKSFGTGASYQSAYSQVTKDIAGLGTIKSIEDMLADMGLGQTESDLRKVIQAFSDLGVSSLDLEGFLKQTTTATEGTTLKTGDLAGQLQDTKTPFQNVIDAMATMAGTTVENLSTVSDFFTTIAANMGLTFTGSAVSTAIGNLTPPPQIEYVQKNVIIGYTPETTKTWFVPGNPYAAPGSKYYTGYWETETTPSAPIWGMKAKGGPAQQGWIDRGLGGAGSKGIEWVAPTYEPERSNFLKETGVADTLKAILKQSGNGGGPVNIEIFIDGERVMARKIGQGGDLTSAIDNRIRLQVN